MLKKITIFLFSLLLFNSWTFAAPTPSIHSEGAILMEEKTGQILYAKNMHEKFYPASTTKILTALLLIEDLDPTTLLTKSAEAIAKVPSDSSHIGLKQGNTYTATDGLHAILMSSDNFVSYDMAVKDASTIDAFSKKMNDRATAIGATDSHFVNPHGYHNPNHYTTPYDLALIAREAFRNPTFAKIAGTHTYAFHEAKSDAIMPLKHTAPLLDKASNFYNPYVIGIKTGFHDASKRVLVAKAAYPNIDLIAVVMHTDAPNQFVDMNTLLAYGSENFSSYYLEGNLPAVLNHSYSPWAKSAIEVALNNKWIERSSSRNYQDAIAREEFIALLQKALPNKLSYLLDKFIPYPDTFVSKAKEPIRRKDAAIVINQFLLDAPLRTTVFYSNPKIIGIEEETNATQLAIRQIVSSRILGSPDTDFMTTTPLSYEQAVLITERLLKVVNYSIPNVFLSKQ